MQAAIRLGSEKVEKIAEGPLAQESHLIENFKQIFLMIAGNATQKFGSKLEEEQQVLQALADILIEIYFAESALLRTLKNCNRNGVKSQEIQIAMVQSYVLEAQSLISKRSKEVVIHLAGENKNEKEQLLLVVQKHGEYIDSPDGIALHIKIADHVIQNKGYCF
jgi:hypothetical protein